MIDSENDLEKLNREINHALRTPLVAIKTGVNAVKDYLPQLIAGYSMAQRNNLAVPPIQSRHLDALSRTLENIEREANSAATYLDSLSLNLKVFK